MTTYVVTLRTKRGLIDVELLSSLGPEAAGRRARRALIAERVYGDIEDVTVVSVTEGSFA